MSAAEVPSVRFRLPAPELRRFITAYYYVTAPESGVEDMLHPEWANLRVALSGHWSARVAGRDYDPAFPAAAFGPTAVGGRVRGAGGTVLGIGLLPLGWGQFVKAPASAFANRCGPLDEVLGDTAVRLEAALRAAEGDDAQVAILDETFGALAAAAGEPDPLCVRAHALLLDPAIGSVEAMAEGLGVSARHLSRLTLRLFGFAPKLLLRRQRFLRTLQALQENPGAGSAGLIDAWYYDQSHFVRDFHHFMGMSPSRYFALPHPLLAPAAQARMQALGASFQGLHGVGEPSDGR